MKRYWTSDLHFGHASIARYCNRPTLRKTDLNDKDEYISSEIAIEAAKRMDEWLIKNINQRIKAEDIVISVGDFLNKGVAKEVPGLRNKMDYYVNQLNGTWVNLRGNHCDNNGVKSIGDYLITQIGPYTAFVAHYPIENINRFSFELIDFVLKQTDFQITAHVHQSWKHKHFIYPKGKYLMYNVGIDIHKYVPISDSDIIGDIMHIKKTD